MKGKAMRLLALLFMCVVAACTGAYANPAPEPRTGIGPVQVPLLVDATCASCHAVRRGELSPLAGAPTFEAIANREGLTRGTFVQFLADSHNYPDVMNVDLSPSDVELIANYMLTLRDEDYRPVP